VAADPLTLVAKGAGRMLYDAALRRRVAWAS
jgi:hypothetical protein